MSALSDALNLLARRELSTQQIRQRLLDRDHTPEDVEAAIGRLTESGALDDGRVARAYARTAANVKGRGRLRIVRELEAIGITREVARGAVADALGDVDEEARIDAALRKKLRGKTITTRQDRARLYNFLVRQGFSGEAASAALRRLETQNYEL